MRKFQFFFLMFFMISLFSFVQYVRTEPIQNAGQGQADSRSSSGSDPLAGFLGNPGRSLPPASAYPVRDPLEAALPAWSERQESSAESKLGWALWEMTQKTGEVAKTVKDSVKTSITDYVKQKHGQMKQQELIDKFYVNLQYVTANLHLAPQAQQELTSRVRRVYIEDAESGRYLLDSLHFRELPYIVRKEYAEMVLARTQNGEVETYYLSGALKTRWVMKNGQPDGPAITYYENGEINFIDVFKDGRKIRRTKYDSEGKLIFEQSYGYDLVPAETTSAPPPADKEDLQPKLFEPSSLEALIWKKDKAESAESSERASAASPSSSGLIEV